MAMKQGAEGAKRRQNEERAGERFRSPAQSLAKKIK
jgi:hypothetical protein